MVVARVIPAEPFTTDINRVGVVTSIRLGDRVGTQATAPRMGGKRGSELRLPDEIRAISEAACVAREAVDCVLKAAVVGAVPSSLAAIASGIIAANRAQSVLRGIELDGSGGFPADCCIAVNDRIIHAVPGDVALKDGDVVTVDVAVSLRGWCADVADCIVVGRGEAANHAMVAGCHEMLEAALAIIAPGVRWSRVAEAMQQVAVSRSLGLVTGYAGHGIGRRLHEAPAAPCCLDKTLVEHGDFTLLPEMVLSVEPVVARRPDGLSSIDNDGYAIGVTMLPCADGWTMRSASGQPGCAVERTVAVTRDGCEVLGEASASDARSED